jgi:purine-binding chemotaxis protein CheW
MTLRPRSDGPIDWENLRKRLEAATASSEAALEISEDRARQIMEERARALARAPEEKSEAGDRIEVVTFALGGERYAVETRYVREIIRVVQVTPMPAVPDLFIGLTNLRGEILPLVDLCRFFGVGRTDLAEAPWAIVLGDGAADLGAPTAAIQETLELPKAGLLKPADTASSQPVDCRLGVTEDALIVIDGAALLADRRLFIAPDRQTLQHHS